MNTGALTPHLLSWNSSPTKYVISTSFTVQCASPGSTTEPESNNVSLKTTAKPKSNHVLPSQPISPGSTTEPESNNVLLSQPISPGSTTEPKSDDGVSPGSTAEPALNAPFKIIFATPSPPPPDSLYWKYVTPEEDARWYDCMGEDNTFNVIW
ncbi:hypothetical protein EDC04DRAFT_2597854 [Pisolithus marmoratus]|nr:hypothetical protein EDC04DRAFT_2597854 [Pisolithus marmoratus]